MAVVLSSVQSSQLEPLKKNRWIIQFTSVPGNITGQGSERLAFCAHTCAQPQITFNEGEQHRHNERFYTPGKHTWNSLPMTFYDFIEGPNSVGHILWEWATSIYNPITGQYFFKTQYMTSAVLALTDPAGGIVRTWGLYYLWPQDVNWGELSSEDDGFVEVSATFRYDFAVKGTDVKTSP